MGKDVCSLIEYQALPLKEALRRVIGKIAELGGEGGLIAVSPTGEIAWEFNSPTLFRGMAGTQVTRATLIGREQS